MECMHIHEIFAYIIEHRLLASNLLNIELVLTRLKSINKWLLELDMGRRLIRSELLLCNLKYVSKQKKNYTCVVDM